MALFHLSARCQKRIIFSFLLKETVVLWRAAKHGCTKTVTFLLKCFLARDIFPKAVNKILLLPEGFFGSGVPKLKVLVDCVMSHKTHDEVVIDMQQKVRHDFAPGRVV